MQHRPFPEEPHAGRQHRRDCEWFLPDRDRGRADVCRGDDGLSANRKFNDVLDIDVSVLGAARLDFTAPEVVLSPICVRYPTYLIESYLIRRDDHLPTDLAAVEHLPNTEIGGSDPIAFEDRRYRQWLTGDGVDVESVAGARYQARCNARRSNAEPFHTTPQRSPSEPPDRTDGNLEIGIHNDVSAQGWSPRESIESRYFCTTTVFVQVGTRRSLTIRFDSRHSGVNGNHSDHDLTSHVYVDTVSDPENASTSCARPMRPSFCVNELRRLLHGHNEDSRALIATERCAGTSPISCSHFERFTNRR